MTKIFIEKEIFEELVKPVEGGYGFDLAEIFKESISSNGEEKQKLFQVIEANGYKWNDETKTLDKLVKSKFDISTLVPFESRVLVRNAEEDIWKPAIFGCNADKTSRYYVLGGTCWSYCIPYEGNEHLLGKNKDCDEYYKTWEE